MRKRTKWWDGSLTSAAPTRGETQRAEAEGDEREKFNKFHEMSGKIEWRKKKPGEVTVVTSSGRNLFRLNQLTFQELRKKSGLVLEQELVSFRKK